MKRRAIVGLCLTALGCLVPAADAEPFYGLLVDAGVIKGSLGSPFTPSEGYFYQHRKGTNYPPPLTNGALADAYLPFDSYVAMGGMPSTYVANGVEPNVAIFAGKYDGLFQPDPLAPCSQLSGVWFSTPPIPFGGFAPTLSMSSPVGADSVFVARLTVQRGAHPIAPKVGIFGMTRKNRTPLYVNAELDGPSTANAGGHPEGCLKLRSFLSDRVELPGFGPADVYDIYVVNDYPGILPAWRSARPPGSSGGGSGDDEGPQAAPKPYAIWFNMVQPNARIITGVPESKKKHDKSKKKSKASPPTLPIGGVPHGPA